jgi:hypothetical protein
MRPSYCLVLISSYTLYRPAAIVHSVDANLDGKPLELYVTSWFGITLVSVQIQLSHPVFPEYRFKPSLNQATSYERFPVFR